MGKLALHDDVSKLLTENLLPYSIVEDPERRTVAVKTQTGEVVSAEALMVSLWLRAKTQMGRHCALKAFSTCLHTYPAFGWQALWAAYSVLR